jgi:hypothetical protein
MGSILDHPDQVSNIAMTVLRKGIANKGRMTTTYRYPYSGGTVRLMHNIVAGERVFTLKCKHWSFNLIVAYGATRVENIWGSRNQIDDFLMLVLMSH